MNTIKVSAFIIALVSVVSAAIDPVPTGNLTLPLYDENGNFTGLATETLGVIASSTREIGSSATLFMFQLGNLTYEGNGVVVPDCVPQLLSVTDTGDDFLLYCDTLAGFSFIMINASNATGLNATMRADFELLDGQIIELSASAFVTQQGDVYLTLIDYSMDVERPNMTVLEFNTTTFNVTAKIDNILDVVDAGSEFVNWTFIDMHSLPFDSGVAVILQAQDNSTNGTYGQTYQYLTYLYFDGERINVVDQQPINQTEMVFVGRHRGSSFGYTISATVDDVLLITAYDLSIAKATNEILIKGTLNNLADNAHFATAEQVWVYTTMSNTAGYVVEMPYSQFGFLPKSVSYVTVDADGDNTMCQGTDGTYVYAFTAPAELTEFQYE